MEKYFQAHRDYFITPSSLKTGTGYATVKEKEMSCIQWISYFKAVYSDKQKVIIYESILILVWKNCSFYFLSSKEIEETLVYYVLKQFEPIINNFVFIIIKLLALN